MFRLVFAALFSFFLSVSVASAGITAMVEVDGDGTGLLSPDFVASFDGSDGETPGIYYSAGLPSNPGDWTQIHTAPAVHMVVGAFDDGLAAGCSSQFKCIRNDLVVDFGPQYGIWEYHNMNSWAQLHTQSSEGMVVGKFDGSPNPWSEDLAVSFEPGGLWVLYHDANGVPSWESIHPLSPDMLLNGGLMDEGSTGPTGKEEIVASWAGQGVWIYRNNTDWEFLHSLDPVAWNSGRTPSADSQNNFASDLIIAFDLPGSSLWQYRDREGDWMFYHPTVIDPDAGAIFVDKVNGWQGPVTVADFGALGTYLTPDIVDPANQWPVNNWQLIEEESPGLMFRLAGGSFIAEFGPMIGNPEDEQGGLRVWNTATGWWTMLSWP